MTRFRRDEAAQNARCRRAALDITPGQGVQVANSPPHGRHSQESHCLHTRMALAEDLGDYLGKSGEWPPQPSRAARAAKDLAEGFAMNWLWTALAFQDIKLRYRGSILGPFWLTVSTLILAVVIGVTYSHLLAVKVPNYIPYLIAGLVLWQLVVATTGEGCDMFTRVGPIIHQVPLPFSVHAYRLVWRNLIVLGHNALVVLAALVFFRVPVDWHILLVLPALFVVAVNALWASTLLGLAGTRFSDLPPIVGSFIQVLFFITPIFWSADALGRWKTLAECNPFFAAIDIVRAPLLGATPEPYSWLVMGLTTILGGGLTFMVFARFRTRIPYWV